MKIIAIAALIVLATACSPFAQAGDTQTTFTPSVTQDGPKSPAVDEPVLIYSRSGGFAGLSETWNIYLDGRIVSAGGEEKQVSPSALQAVLDQFQQADFASIKSMTLETSGCADCFQVELALNMGKEQIRLSVVPESQEADPTAVALVEAVQELLNSAQ